MEGVEDSCTGEMKKIEGVKGREMEKEGRRCVEKEEEGRRVQRR